MSLTPASSMDELTVSGESRRRSRRYNVGLRVFVT